MTRLISLSMVVGIVTLGFGAARAAGPEPEPEVATAIRAQARQLFEQGDAHYALGEYDLAIARFREAYELTQAPALLFNIAQAHRLAGHCRQALEVYRHFLRLAPESPYHAEAEARREALVTSCPPSPPAAPPPRVGAETPPALATLSDGRPGPPGPDGRSAVNSRWPTSVRVAVGLLLGGVAAGAAAGLFYRWNNGRYDEWSTQDRRLATGAAPGSSEMWVARQNANDDLLRSIHRTDGLVAALAAASATCFVGSAVIGVMPGKSSPAPTASGEIKLSLGWSWR